MIAFKFKETGGEYELIVTNETLGDMQDEMPGGGDGDKTEEEKQMQKAMMDMMKPMFAGMKIELSVTVPGEIEEATGFLEKEDRTAKVVLKLDDVFEAQDENSEIGKKFKKMREEIEKHEGSRVTWSENEVSEDDIAEFKKELEKAKEEWKKILEEAEKGKDEDEDEEEEKKEEKKDDGGWDWGK
jgi:hypothetical protein